MFKQAKVEGKKECSHKFVATGKKIITESYIRCTECGREEVHEEVQEKR